jgi:hypothetical protein
MAKPQRVVYFKTSIEDKPGTLLSITSDTLSSSYACFSSGEGIHSTQRLM